MPVWSFHYQLKGAPKLWVASIVFVVVGAVIEFFVPSLISQSGGQDEVGLIVVRILGGVFLVLGGLVLAMMLVSLYIDRTCPQNKEVWQWWVNLIGGMLGAATFAVPSTFVLPGLYLAYTLSPNPLYPDPSKDFSHDFFIGLLFSALGILSLLGLYFISRASLRHRPRWKP